jgi:uncharacterized lipoprotein YddW (UPF0748 family)
MGTFMMRLTLLRALFYLLLLSLPTALRGQVSEVPKREFRGVWVATVGNIDWPSKPGLPAEQQKAELLRILDEHQQNGINAIMLQVRPAADALYASSYEPWSRYLSGTQGKAPQPYYDPLEFAITEAHKRGMELHAWFNPYRATTDLVASHVSADHITRTHPNWFFIYDGKKLFNPGIPQVRDYIVQVVMDVVRRYDIDGIHFDDYFYPYKDKYNSPIPDTYTYSLFGAGFTDIKDWRRQNVDTLIHTLSDSIHAAKKYVKFGVSPFGIWKNSGQDTLGSQTNGGSSYLEQYADSRKWVQKGWVDYINPQIYWSFGYRAAPFENLLSWWSLNTYGRHLYVGQAAYRASATNAGWQDRSQIPRQVRAIRNDPRAQGSIYFSSASLSSNLGGARDSLRYDLYKFKALQPPMLWLDNVAPKAPMNLVARASGNRIDLNWSRPLPADDGEPVYGYVVYRFNEGEEVNIGNPQNIVSISFDRKTLSFADQKVREDVRYTYAVTAIDRLKNESAASNLTVIKINEE